MRLLKKSAVCAWAAAAALAWGSRPSSAAPASLPASVPATSFSFRADGVPIKQALAMFARANQLTIVPDLDVQGMVTVDFHDLPLDLAMSALLDANGYYCVQEGRLLRVRNQETRIFQVDYIRVTRASQGSNQVQISSAGESGGSGGSSPSGGSSSSSGGSTEGSEMTVTNTSNVNFWADLGDQLKSMLSSTGTFTINSLAGTIVVKDSHQNVETVAQFLSAVGTNIVRQIDIDVEIYEVQLTNSDELGINWQSVSSSLNLTSIPGNLGLSSAGGVIVQNSIFGSQPPAAAVQATYQHSGISAVLDALKQQGTLKVVSRPRLRTLNNQPAVVRVGEDLPVFSRQVTQSPGSPPVITTNETVQTVTVGTVLSITPQISADGLITLDISPAVSRLVSTQVSPDGTISAPVIDIRQASSLVRVRDGVTVVMGGLVQDSKTVTRNSVPVLGDIPLVGKLFSGNYTDKERTELVFFVTPRVVFDGGSVGGSPVSHP
jgi:MSHA type pilus biogenesis protein MshL